MKNITLISTAVLLMTFTSISTAQIYKWVDKNGRLHYTQRPAPTGNKAEDIEDKIRLAAILKKKEKDVKKHSPYFHQEKEIKKEAKALDSNKTQLRDEIASKQKTAEDNYREQLEGYCNSQQINLEKLQSSNPIAWEEDGKTILLTVEQKRAKAKVILKSVGKNCSSKKS